MHLNICSAGLHKKQTFSGKKIYWQVKDYCWFMAHLLQNSYFPKLWFLCGIPLGADERTLLLLTVCTCTDGHLCDRPSRTSGLGFSQLLPSNSGHTWQRHWGRWCCYPPFFNVVHHIMLCKNYNDSNRIRSLSRRDGQILKSDLWARNESLIWHPNLNIQSYIWEKD